MNSNLPRQTDDNNLPTLYKAMLDYHNTLVQVRFTIAGLYLTATGFLVNSWFSIDHQKSNYAFTIPILGISLALLCWLLEIRTKHLLINLGDTGIKIEKKMEICNYGFFDLMDTQPIQPILPFTQKVLEPKLAKKIISHTLGFNLIYLVIFIFWIFALITCI